MGESDWREFRASGATETDVATDVDVDVAIVGGGPAGCSAGVFTARYGLETTIFDRGPSSLRRCASLENYLGFPCGIDVETFLELAQDHAERAGCRLREDHVESVVALEAGGDRGFRLELQEADPITARFVVAATKYDGEYLRGLDDETAMFVTEADGDDDRFDRDYPDDDGTTSVDGLYVAGPLAGCGDQAIVAAGHGATAARTLIRELREEAGLWGKYAGRYDWRRRMQNRREEWADPERWVEVFEERVPENHDAAPLHRLAETYAEEYDGTYLEEAVATQRAERGQRRLAAALEDEIVLDAVDDDAILDRAAALAEDGSSGG